jgi:hypothetical protein
MNLRDVPSGGRLAGRVVVELTRIGAAAWSRGDLRTAERLLEGAQAIIGSAAFVDQDEPDDNPDEVDRRIVEELANQTTTNCNRRLDGGENR